MQDKNGKRIKRRDAVKYQGRDHSVLYVTDEKIVLVDEDGHPETLRTPSPGHPVLNLEVV